MGGQLHKIGFCGLIIVMFCHGASAKLADVDESKAREALAQTLIRILTKQPDLKVRQYDEGSSEETNYLDGNPFGSLTTYHSKAFSHCLEGGTYGVCAKWNDPYVAEHGMVDSEDKSPLEAAAAEMWKATSKTAHENVEADAKGEQTRQHGIWQVTAKDPEQGFIHKIRPKRGSINMAKVADLRLMPELKQEIEEIGKRTAEKAMNFSYDENAKVNGKELLNTERGRAMASAFTRQFRNRTLANIGAIRAARPGIEFELSEQVPNCDAYVKLFKAGGSVEINVKDILFHLNREDDDRLKKRQNF